MNPSRLLLRDPSRRSLEVGTVAQIATLTGRSVVEVYQRVCQRQPIDGIRYRFARSGEPNMERPDRIVKLPPNGLTARGKPCRDTLGHCCTRRDTAWKYDAMRKPFDEE